MDENPKTAARKDALKREREIARMKKELSSLKEKHDSFISAPSRVKVAEERLAEATKRLEGLKQARAESDARLAGLKARQAALKARSAPSGFNEEKAREHFRKVIEPALKQAAAERSALPSAATRVLKSKAPSAAPAAPQLHPGQKFHGDTMHGFKFAGVASDDTHAPRPKGAAWAKGSPVTAPKAKEAFNPKKFDTKAYMDDQHKWMAEAKKSTGPLTPKGSPRRFHLHDEEPKQHALQTGEKGGQYYTTASGQKVYVGKGK